MGVTAFDTISATRINIVNDAGKIQATITSDRDGGRVVIFDAAGQYQAIMEVDDDGGRLVFYDNNEKNRCWVGVDKADQSVAIDDPAGNENNILTDDTDQAELMRMIVEDRLYNTTEMRYDLYLQTAEWQTLRRIKLETAGHRCQVCNSDAGPLDVHHRTYERRGKEHLDDLTVLCRRCHQAHHKKKAITGTSETKSSHGGEIAHQMAEPEPPQPQDVDNLDETTRRIDALNEIVPATDEERQAAIDACKEKLRRNGIPPYPPTRPRPANHPPEKEE